MLLETILAWANLADAPENSQYFEAEANLTACAACDERDARACESTLRRRYEEKGEVVANRRRRADVSRRERERRIVADRSEMVLWRRSAGGRRT